MKRLPYLLGATGLALALFTVSCTTIGTHVKGGFACKAPQGTCAPMSMIDAQAIAGLGAGGGQVMPVGGGAQDGPAGMVMTAAMYGEGEPARTGDRTIKVVFPAHSDANGVFHEEAVAHVVAEWSRWTLRPSPPPVPGSLEAAIQKDAPSAQSPVAPVATIGGDPTSGVPLNLREAAAGLHAPADPAPAPPQDPSVVDGTDTQAGAPSADALAAARAGHRIGEPIAQKMPTAHRPAGKARRPAQISIGGPGVPGAATAALNRDQLRRILAKTSATHRDLADAGKSREIASAEPLAATAPGVRP